MNMLAPLFQKALYYALLPRLPFGRAAAEIWMHRHFQALPAYIRLHRLYKLGELFRPHYYLGVRRALDLADKLGCERFSIAEFGVAEGNGVLLLQNIVRALRDHPKHGRKQIHIYGFDTFEGLPEIRDMVDGSTMWKGGDFPSDLVKLRRAADPALLTLVPGLFSDSIAQVAAQWADAPLLFSMVDCDLYSSTVSIFDALFPAHVPPASYWYFDDTRLHFYSEQVGERRAIKEFNERAGNPFHFVPDYLALREDEPVPTTRTLCQHYYCIDDEAYARQIQGKDEVQRLPLNPRQYAFFAEHETL